MFLLPFSCELAGRAASVTSISVHRVLRASPPHVCLHRLAELPWGGLACSCRGRPARSPPPALWIPSGSAPGAGATSDRPMLEGRRQGSRGPSAPLGSGQSTCEGSRVRAAVCPLCSPRARRRGPPFPPPPVTRVRPRAGQRVVSRCL